MTNTVDYLDKQRLNVIRGLLDTDQSAYRARTVAFMVSVIDRQAAQIARLQAISDAAEDLISYRGSAREDEMWAKLHDVLFAPTCKSGEEEESE